MYEFADKRTHDAKVGHPFPEGKLASWEIELCISLPKVGESVDKLTDVEEWVTGFDPDCHPYPAHPADVAAKNGGNSIDTSHAGLHKYHELQDCGEHQGPQIVVESLLPG